MINMAVINLRDVIKYIIKITIVITLIIGAIKYFSKAKDNISQNVQKLEEVSLVSSCLNITIPGIANINNKEEEKTSSQIQPYKLALGLNLGVMSHIETASDKVEENNKQEIKNNDKNNEEKPVEKAKEGLQTEVQSSNVPEKYTTQYNGVKIKNEAKYKLTKEILTPNITVNNKNILIFHTHSCESYTATKENPYKQTGNFRTTDKNYSVIRVGNELELQLKSYGYNVIHDEEYHDYPSYSGSYSSSLKTVTNLLEKNKNTDVVIDVHRDAIGDSNYAPTVKIGEEYAAQLMFVIGGNGSSIKHENWQQNLKFAIKVQEKANELYPGLFKPIILRQSGYNQHVAKAATIIEVGATGNTLEQTLISMKYLAKVLSEVVK